MNAKQRAYRLLWRAQEIAADDITQFTLVGSLSGWMGQIWEGLSQAEKDEVWKAGPAKPEEVHAMESNPPVEEPAKEPEPAAPVAVEPEAAPPPELEEGDIEEEQP